MTRQGTTTPISSLNRHLNQTAALVLLLIGSSGACASDQVAKNWSRQGLRCFVGKIALGFMRDGHTMLTYTYRSMLTLNFDSDRHIVTEKTLMFSGDQPRWQDRFDAPVVYAGNDKVTTYTFELDGERLKVHGDQIQGEGWFEDTERPWRVWHTVLTHTSRKYQVHSDYHLGRRFIEIKRRHRLGALTDLPDAVAPYHAIERMRLKRAEQNRCLLQMRSQ